MIVLRIEHKISNYADWKKAFDNDPINRKQSGVKHYQIFQPTEDENYVIIDLEFQSLDEAKATKLALQHTLTKVEGNIIFVPQIRLLNVIESKDV